MQINLQLRVIADLKLLNLLKGNKTSSSKLSVKTMRKKIPLRSNSKTMCIAKGVDYSQMGYKCKQNKVWVLRKKQRLTTEDIDVSGEKT